MLIQNLLDACMTKYCSVVPCKLQPNPEVLEFCQIVYVGYSAALLGLGTSRADGNRVA